MSYNGRVALVTGAGRGIGRTIALRLSHGGAAVAVNDILPESAAQVADEITTSGGQALSVPGDVSTREGVSAVVKAIISKYGRLDVLVNNAGVTQDQLLVRMSDEEWENVLAVNLRSVFLCSRAAVRYMLKGRWGRIISIASVTGLIGNAGQTNYGAAKAGIIGLTRSLAREVGARGITVNAVAPGFIETDMTAKLTDKRRRESLSTVPMGRPGTTEDVAAACAFLASDDASYITGHVLTVDGGMTCI